ncbi:MAG: helix-turn-helix domain-containing protein [Solirubrobacterales bacterium]|nr:helix-turn-helix domain-containing protein [Solirubrobacterales bacterium]MCB8969994.1 helix-turn-helix domain-containing protein [Thermoleophilales bacterium]MCO5327734.1 helix-turn-helix domain-containing protein [Solirubrobacterales bacterium]
MDKRFLEECLTKGMSLPEIGRLTGKLPGSVSYWVRKHGLTANGRAKFSPARGHSPEDRENLAALVEEGLTLKEIASILGVAPGTVRNRIRAYGLEGTRASRRIERIRAARASGSNEVMLECPTHGLTAFWVGKQHARCKRCNTVAVAKRRRRVKEILVEEAGGSCVRCGFSDSLAALEFHHLDPKTKAFAISAQGVTKSIDSLRAEARKCVLLCANCHAMVEAGAADVPLR